MSPLAGCGCGLEQPGHGTGWQRPPYPVKGAAAPNGPTRRRRAAGNLLGAIPEPGGALTATTTARPKQGAWIAAMDQLQGTVDETLAGIDKPRVLEAGCGSAAYVRFPSSSHITGID